VVALALTPAVDAQKPCGLGVAITELEIGQSMADSGPTSLSIAFASAGPYNGELAACHCVACSRHQKWLRLASVRVGADAMAYERTLNHLREE